MSTTAPRWRLSPLLTVLTRHSPLELCRGRAFVRNAYANRMGAGSWHGGLVGPLCACCTTACLLTRYPGCGKYQRRQQVTAAFLHPQWVYVATGGAETVKPPTDHVIVDARRQVLKVINESDMSFGAVVASRSSVRDVLVAARSLANRVLNYASTHGLAAVTSAEVSWPSADDSGSKPLLARNALNV